MPSSLSPSADMTAHFLNAGGAMTIFRLPQDHKLKFCGHEEIRYEIPELESGFVYSPFNTKNSPVIFIPGEIKELDSLPAWTDEIPYWPHPKDMERKNTSKRNYVAGVKKISDSPPTDNTPGKLVLSAIRNIQTQQKISDTFLSVCDKYPSAFVCLFYSPVSGCWLTASPEPLLKRTQDEITLYSLAGTKPTGLIEDWGEKEKEEFGFVSDYIIEVAAAEGLGKPIAGEVKTTRYGPISHLLQSFQFSSCAEIKNLNLVKALHPTPAVCGTPKNLAKQWLARLEKHDRKYFTGYFGIWSGSKTLLHVNLRTLSWQDDQVKQYAGAGITRGSKPEEEWEEVIQKMNTMFQPD